MNYYLKQIEEEVLQKIQTERDVNLRHLDYYERQAAEKLRKEGKVGSYMGDSGPRRYTRK